jgi:hypothetical protein
MSDKPCLQCGTECKILPVQLGDIFTLAYIRFCSAECLFMMTYEYLYKIGYHKSFRNSLLVLEEVEDAAMRKDFVDTVTDDALKVLHECLQDNSNLLSTHVNDSILKIFEGVPPIPSLCSNQTIRFTRLSKQEKIRLQTDHINRLKDSLRDALHDLEKMEND